MRNVIEKRKVDIRDTTALDNFKDNLSADGTYTVHQDVLDKSFKALPHHMRNADLTMIAGAYKEGAIAMMDKLGNIVDLGFSRSTIRSAISEYEYTNYPIDTPRLDNFNYGQVGINGYLIENERHNFLSNFTFPSNSIFVAGVTGTATSLLNPYTRTLLNDGLLVVNSYGERSSNRPNRTVDNSTGKIFFNIFFRVTNPNSSAPWYALCDAFGDGSGSVGSARNDRFDFLTKTVVYNSGSGNSVWKYHSHKELPNGLCRVTFVQNNITRLTLDNTNNFWMLLQISNNTSLVTNDARHVYKDGAIYSMTSHSYCTEAEGGNLEHFDFDANYKAPDIISTITLTNDAVIHIKTAKGVQDFVLNTGSTFNVNDYVTNDKLICFAIKYLPNIEVFIDNLIADGTYTFDDNVIRDSWSNLLNRANTDSTFRNALCNADHVVIPYAYRTGYVAAMNLEDGSIIDIEFERSGSAYSFQNENLIPVNSNVVVYDEYLHDSFSKGYLFEEGIINVTNNMMSGLLNVANVGGSFYDLSNPRMYECISSGQARVGQSLISRSAVPNSKLKVQMLIRHSNIISNTVFYISASINPFVGNMSFNIGTELLTSNRRVKHLFNDFYLVDCYFLNDTSTNNFSTRNSSLHIVGTSSVGGSVGERAEVPFISYKYYGDNIQRPNFEDTQKIMNPNSSVGKDHLKTESYSKICTIGVRTGIRVGAYTDPQSLVQNDKINFIFLKQ